MQTTRTSVKRNFVYNIGYQIFRIIIPFITTPYLSRVLGVEAIGVHSFTVSIQTYFIMIAALGTITYGTREISRHRDDAINRSKIFWEIELLTVGTSLVALLGWLLVIWQSETYRVYYLILSIGIIATLFDISWFFNGMEQFKLTVMRSMIIRIIGIVCIFVLIKEPEDLPVYILINSLTTLLSSLTLWPYLTKYLVKISPKDFKFKRHLKETFVFFIPTIASTVYTVLDKTLIGVVTNDLSQNGFYERAENIISMAKSVVYQSLNAVIGVRISYLYKENKTDEIKKRIENSINYIFFMGFGCCFGIMGISKTFIPFCFGEGYEGVIPLMYILCPIIIIIGVSNCLDTQYYIPFGRQAMSARFIIAGAVVNLCMNLFLIPKLAAKGAAIASIIAELLILCLFVCYSQGYGRVSLLIKCGYKKFVASILMFVAVFYLNGLALPNIFILGIQILSGICIYIVILLLLRDEWIYTMYFAVKNRIKSQIIGK